MFAAPSIEEYYDEEPEDDAEIDVYRITKNNNILVPYGNRDTMNLNPLVLENVVQSQYNKNVLVEYTTYQQVIEEALYNVRHLEPWERGTRKTQGMTGMCGGVRGVGAGGVVSTAFCCLYKFHTLRITRRQLIGLIDSRQSIFLRGLGFMYVRYTQPPSDLWYWFEPYFDDDEEIDPRSGGGDKMTIGAMVKLMLTKLDWYGTLFPRIPVPIQKQIDENFAAKRREALPAKEFGSADCRNMLFSRNRDREREHDDRDNRKREAEKKTTKNAPAPKKIKTRCGHHLRHHHCLKHRKECPRKAKEERAKREAEKSQSLSKPSEDELKNGSRADVHMGDVGESKQE